MHYFQIMFICQICMDTFTTTCDTYSTLCGHIFHNNCLNVWFQRREPTCPTCRNYCQQSVNNTGIHKVYLPFDPDYQPRVNKLTTEISDLKAQLENAERRAADAIAAAQQVNPQYMDSEEEFDLDVLRAENSGLMAENETLHKIIELTEADVKDKKEIIYAFNSILDDIENAQENENRQVTNVHRVGYARGYAVSLICF